MSKRLILIGAIFFCLIIGLIFMITRVDGFEFIGLIASILILVIYLILIRSEKNSFNNIILEYSASCNTKKYIDNLKKFQKKVFQTKRNKATFNLFLASAYVDSGKFDLALPILLSFDENQKYMDSSTILLYLKVWSEYYYYTLDALKMKEVLDKMKDIIDKTNDKRKKIEFGFLYSYQEAKYFVLSGNNLNDAMNLFEKRKAILPTSGVAMISNVYHMALCNLRMKNYNIAYSLFKKLAESKAATLDDTLYIIRKAGSFYCELEHVIKEV